MIVERVLLIKDLNSLKVIANSLLIELTHLRNENERLIQQNDDLKATIFKLTNGQKTLNMLLGSQKYVNGKRWYSLF